ncbi:MAG TPA: LamG-like jellyroll fold domain-containing protein, partial [Verrucomicrobiae bacterium]|nr:LamG-like jellyroll fold domain-containing protein [Verrucomicrobiae bacterium]
TNDVPPSAPPGSASLYFNNAGLMVANSSTLDAGYTNTFDNKINNGMTVMCWAKGWPGGWNPFVSKYGDNGLGWQLRSDGSGGNPGYATWTVRGGGGAVRIGAGVYGNAEDLATRSINTKDDQWHHYAATYSPLTGVRSLYVDGKLAAYETGQGPLNRTTASHLMIGARDNGGNNFQAYFTGEMYDVRVYDYALPQSQVVAAKNGQNLPVPGQDFFATSGQTATFTTPAVSAAPPYMGYRWQLNGANLTDGANDGATISGSSTLALTVSNLTANNTGVYQLLVTNTSGVTTDSIVNVGIVPPSEVGRWLSGSVSNLTDVSGFSPAGVHDASVQSGSVYWTNDVPNGAPAGSYSLGFNNAGLIVSNSSTWDPGYTNTFDNMIQNGMTVMLWAKGVPGGWNPWVSKFGDNALGWQLRVNNGGVPTWTIRGTGGNEDMSGNKASDGNWHHYTGTYSPVTGVRSLYVDGVLVATQTNQGPYNMTSSSHLMIGAKDSGGNTYGSQFTGRIYDVRVYNYPLTQSELAAVVPGLTPSFTAKQIISGASGGQLVLTWPFGTLLEATNVAGPWTTNNVTSPYTNDLTLPQEFFKLQNP